MNLKQIIDELNEIVEKLKVLNDAKIIKGGTYKGLEKKEEKEVKTEDARQYKISSKPCKNCGGLVSWDLFPDRKYPLHVDDNGYKIGDGNCPNYEG